jgi:hypothetical protein
MLTQEYKSCSEQLFISAFECVYKEKNLYYITPPLLSLLLKPEPELELELELKPEATPLLLISISPP